MGFKDIFSKLNFWHYTGLAGEVFLLMYLTFFFTFIIIIRWYLRNFTKAHSLYIEYESNKASAYIGFCSLVTYLTINLKEPVNLYNDKLMVYTDSSIYFLKLTLGILFLIYYVYVIITTINYYIYKFDYYFVLIAVFFGLNLMLVSANFTNLMVGVEICSLSTFYLLYSERFSNNFGKYIVYYIYFAYIGTIFLIFAFCLVDTIIFFNLEEYSYLDQIGYLIVFLGLIAKIIAGLAYFWTLPEREGMTFSILILFVIFVKPIFFFVIFKLIYFFSCPLSFKVFSFFLLVLLLLVGIIGLFLISQIQKFLIFASSYSLGFYGLLFLKSSLIAFNYFILFYFVYAINLFVLMVIIYSFRIGVNRQLNLNDWFYIIIHLSQNKFTAFIVSYLFFSLAGVSPFGFFFFKYLIVILELFSSHLLIFLVSFLIVLNIISILTFFVILIKVNKWILRGAIKNFFYRSVSYLLSFVLTINLTLLAHFDEILHYFNSFI